jgi:hypothetical protein
MTRILSTQLWKVQKHFLSNVAGTESLDHWQRLELLHHYSQERRRERYVVGFLWKISEGLVKGYQVSFTDNDNGRRGRMAVPLTYARTSPAAVKKARERSLGAKGCQLFNLLPPTIRNMTGVTTDVSRKLLMTSSLQYQTNL